MAGGTLGTAGQTSVKSEPNVVPMIDIMLVLLIIFMIVTPLIAAGFKATLPKGKNLDPRPEGDNEVVLGIDQAGRYFLNQRPIAAGALEDQLRSVFAARGDRPARRRPRDGSHHRAPGQQRVRQERGELIWPAEAEEHAGSSRTSPTSFP
jgi:biopolymer transport protein ExbD